MPFRSCWCKQSRCAPVVDARCNAAAAGKCKLWLNANQRLPPADVRMQQRMPVCQCFFDSSENGRIWSGSVSENTETEEIRIERNNNKKETTRAGPGDQTQLDMCMMCSLCSRRWRKLFGDRPLESRWMLESLVLYGMTKHCFCSYSALLSRVSSGRSSTLLFFLFFFFFSLPSFSHETSSPRASAKEAPTLIIGSKSSYSVSNGPE